MELTGPVVYIEANQIQSPPQQYPQNNLNSISSNSNSPLTKGFPSRPVRFPQGQKRIYYDDYATQNDDQINRFYDHYAPYTPEHVTMHTTAKPTVNILAELAKYSKKKNASCRNHNLGLRQIR